MAVLLYGHDFSAEDMETATGVAATLERRSIRTLEDGSMYRVHDDHVDFVLECITNYPKTKQKAVTTVASIA